MAVISMRKKNDILDSEMKKRFWDLLNDNTDDCNEELKKIADKNPIEIPQELNDYVSRSSNFNLKGYSGHNNRTYRVSLKLNLKLSDTYPQRRADWDGKVLEPTKKLLNLFEKRVKIMDRRALERKQLKAVLNSFNTDKKLLTAVPELKEYFKDDFVCTALIPIEDINAVRKILKKTNAA